MERIILSTYVTFILSSQANRVMCNMKCGFGSIEHAADAVPNEYCCKHECLCVCVWGESFNAAPFDCCGWCTFVPPLSRLNGRQDISPGDWGINGGATVFYVRTAQFLGLCTAELIRQWDCIIAEDGWMRREQSYSTGGSKHLDCSKLECLNFSSWEKESSRWWNVTMPRGEKILVWQEVPYCW